LRAAILSGLLLAGCGGSGHPASTSTRAATTATAHSAASTATGTLPAPPTTTRQTTTPQTTTSQTTTSQTATPQTTLTQPPPVASGARIPATFRLGPGARATPPVVNAPALIPIALTLISTDGAHTALVRTPTPHTLHVPAGGRAEVLLSGLREGHYTIVLDHGAGTLALMVGGQPGP
jgi:hypothetical protein